MYKDTKILHDTPLDVSYKVVDFVFKRGTRDCITTNKQGCASWSSKKKKGITSFLQNHYLKKQENFFYITVFSLLQIS